MQPKSKAFLGIDTSNYTTSLALVDEKGDVLANARMLLPVAEKACGLRQSDALFHHTRQLPMLFEKMQALLSTVEVVAVGVSEKPRRQEGSYMPCFLAGVASAVSIASLLACPMYRFSHQCGHIMAAATSAGLVLDNLSAFGAFHISGGTTELVLASPCPDGFDTKIIGGTLDLNAGQAIDRIGVMMGLFFPCGKEMERLAREKTNLNYASPNIKISAKDGYINLSGLENQAKKYYEETKDASATSLFVLDYLAEAVVYMSDYFRGNYGEMPLLYAGGVMSNHKIRKAVLSRVKEAYFGESVYSTDNAVGVALLARRTHKLHAPKS